MKRVLLLNPPGDKFYLRDMYCSSVSKARYYWPPIDLLIQSGIIGQKYEVDVMDAMIEGVNVDDCRKRIRRGNYEAILFLTSTASWKQDFAFLETLRDSGGAFPLLIGNGDILLYEAEKFLNDYRFLDAVLFDYTSRDIVHYLGGDFNRIGSMAFRTNGGIEIRKKEVRPQEFSYPIPYHEKFLLKRYLLAQGRKFPFTTIQMSFGCPFRCSFCIASTLGFKWRAVDNVLEEIDHIVSLGIKEVFFSDFTFEARRKNAVELCRRMVREKINLSWTCSSRASTLDRKLLAWMKLAGCHTILIGVESGDEKILEEYSKGVTKDEVRKTFSLCREMGIRTLGHFIIGLPGETEETVAKTIRFSRELACDFASFNIAVPSMGTPLRENAIKNGWLRDNALEFDSSSGHSVIETPLFSKEQVWKWRNRAIRGFYFRPSYLLKLAMTSYSAYQWRILIRNGLALVKNAMIRDGA